jgi:hypothetical protein
VKRVEVYTVDDLKRDLKAGARDTEVALKKWESILNLLKTVEEVAVQATSFCFKYQQYGCSGCPIVKYDYPCGHPYAAFTIFYQELRKLRMIGERLYMILASIDKEEREKQYYG